MSVESPGRNNPIDIGSRPYGSSRTLVKADLFRRSPYKREDSTGRSRNLINADAFRPDPQRPNGR
ncbi:MAG: hypothetical protein ACREHC_03080 [Candidatus Levyibacteriota bacterium]